MSSAASLSAEEARSRLRIGAAIRELRKSRHIPIKELAKALDRSVGYISQVERGMSQPTLKDLYAASAVFNVTMNWFLDPGEPAGPDNGERGIIVRADRRRILTEGDTRTEVLTPQLDPKLEFMISTFSPLETTEQKSVVASGAEYGLMLRGTLELWIDGQKFVLRQGDSYKFDRSSKYHSRNPSATEPAVVVWVGLYTAT